jgi:hypothetical protein
MAHHLFTPYYEAGVKGGVMACSRGLRSVARLVLLGALSMWSEASWAQGASTVSFCTPTENIMFACRAGAKMVSVCASKDAGPAQGYLQYRFGKANSADPIELTLPEARLPPAKAAKGSAEGYSGGGGVWLRFSKGEFAYTVYSGIGNWGPRGQKQTKEGLLVERGGKQLANLPCSGALTSDLSPDWFEKMGVVRGDQEFFFPD